jgi:UDP-N-acetylmuramoyl-L-alanyl-D-glutamate--2,6-diaminopimelate ligase
MSMPAEILRPNVTLDQLLKGMAAAPAIPVSGISSDSRNLAEGNVFIASQGRTSHGLDFLEQAVAAKVAAVVWDPGSGDAPPVDIPMIPVAGLTGHIGTIANRFFDTPSKRIRVSGVTGTNGKTTVAYLIRQCLQRLGHKCAYIGTLGNGIDEISSTNCMTTPACIDLHRQLAEFSDAGAGQAAIEVSSHALEQGRVDGMHFDTAIFTNLSRDHIDYHGSMRAYGDTKARLFLDFDVNNRIVSLDTEFGQEIAELCGPNVVTVSTRFDRVANGRPYVFVRAVVATEGGSRVSVMSSWGAGEFLLPLPGDFNVSNAVEVLAAMLCWDVPLVAACKLLGNVSAPPGRMQRVYADGDAQLPAVFVDYAHTPASLEAALRALRQHCKGKLWCVFGCGGDRDRGKRARMGKIATRHADRPVVTNDNPRSEPPAAIIAGILDEMDDDTVVIEDRGAAIAHAVSAASKEDVVLIAGKGHEEYQIVGKQRLKFSDYNIALANMQARREKGTSGQ